MLVLLLIVVFAQDECDVEFDLPVCSPKGLPMQGQKFMDTLKILLSFDDILVVNKGPTLQDERLSAYFSGKEYVEMEQSDQTPYFTYAMWLFFPKQSGATKPRNLCPIFQKGNDGENYPSLYFDQKNRQLYAQVDQTIEVQDNFLSTVGRIQYNSWIYVAVVATSNKLKIYLNGVLDNIFVFQASPKPNNSPLYVGSVPWLKDTCSMPYLMDRFQYYNDEIKAYFLQAQSQLVLQIEQASIHFGCVNCGKDEAKGACIAGYHLCTQMELFQSIGWVDWNSYIWTYNDLIRSEEKVGLGVCCID
ncbi:hypothetical protein pb186bvf_006555 [Paramecium bursaria]